MSEIFKRLFSEVRGTAIGLVVVEWSCFSCSGNADDGLDGGGAYAFGADTADSDGAGRCTSPTNLCLIGCWAPIDNDEECPAGLTESLCWCCAPVIEELPPELWFLLIIPFSIYWIPVKGVSSLPGNCMGDWFDCSTSNGFAFLAPTVRIPAANCCGWSSSSSPSTLLDGRRMRSLGLYSTLFGVNRKRLSTGMGCDAGLLW